MATLRGETHLIPLPHFFPRLDPLFPVPTQSFERIKNEAKKQIQTFNSRPKARGAAALLWRGPSFPPSFFLRASPAPILLLFSSPSQHYKRKAFIQLAVMSFVVSVLVVCMVLRSNEALWVTSSYPSSAAATTGSSSRDMLLIMRVLAISPADMMMTLEGDVQSAPGLVDPVSGHIINPFQIRVYGGVTTLLRFQKGNLFSQFNVQVRAS